MRSSKECQSLFFLAFWSGSGDLASSYVIMKKIDLPFPIFSLLIHQLFSLSQVQNTFALFLRFCSGLLVRKLKICRKRGVETPLVRFGQSSSGDDLCFCSS